MDAHTREGPEIVRAAVRVAAHEGAISKDEKEQGLKWLVEVEQRTEKLTPEQRKALEALLNDIDAMRDESRRDEFGPFSGEQSRADYTVTIDWPNLSITRDEVKRVFGI